MLGTKLMRAYFNYAYNPVYDLVVGRLNIYRQLQERCVAKLELEDGDRVLCVGLGTGNEVAHILKLNMNVSIVGVDYSHTALRKARSKAMVWGKEIEVLSMDARCVEFTAGSFDKVLCIHVTEFIPEREKVTGEIIRVLKEGGRFVITYPSEKENLELGINLLKDRLHRNLEAGNRIKGISRFLAQTVISAAYFPLLLRSKRKCYSSEELQRMFVNLVEGDFQIEAHPIYQDFIVYGKK